MHTARFGAKGSRFNRVPRRPSAKWGDADPPFSLRVVPRDPPAIDWVLSLSKMAGIFAVGARSEITKPKSHPAGSHLVVSDVRLSPASGAQLATLHVFAHGAKESCDELAALLLEQQAVAAGCTFPPEKIARIATINALALDTFSDYGRADILKHLHAPRLTELSIVQPIAIDPLIGKLVTANIAVVDGDGDALIILDGIVNVLELARPEFCRNLLCFAHPCLLRRQ